MREKDPFGFNFRRLMMRKMTTVSLLALSLSILNAPVANAIGLTNLAEGFESVSALAPAWGFVNNSDPAPFTPPATWAQGNPGTGVTAQAGAPSSFTQVNQNSSAGNSNQQDGQVSNWLITPELDFSQGGTFSFYARTFPDNSAAEFIEVRQSSAGTSLNVGSTAQSLGDFTTLVGSAGDLQNPTALPGTSWGFYTFNVAPTGGSGRLAFRSFATNGGVNGTQGFFGAVDTVGYNAVPEPASSSLAGFAVLGLASYFKGKRKRSI
jgi:hypothetical protein